MVAALTVADRVGLHALTIRAVARQVGAPPMSLYTHFSNKDELIDLMYLEVVRHLYQDEANPTWQTEVMSVCRRIYSTFLEHPNWMPLLGRRVTPTDVPARERILSMMVADGITPEAGFGILTSAGLASTGLVIAQLTYMDDDGASTLTRRWQTLHEWTASVAHVPFTRQAVAERKTFQMRDVFERTLTALIRGFELTARDATLKKP